MSDDNTEWDGAREAHKWDLSEVQNLSLGWRRYGVQKLIAMGSFKFYRLKTTWRVIKCMWRTRLSCGVHRLFLHLEDEEGISVTSLPRYSIMCGSEVNVPAASMSACQRWACHVHTRGEGSGRRLTQVGGFTIFDKRAEGLLHQSSRSHFIFSQEIRKMSPSSSPKRTGRKRENRSQADLHNRSKKAYSCRWETWPVVYLLMTLADWSSK